SEEEKRTSEVEALHRMEHILRGADFSLLETSMPKGLRHGGEFVLPFYHASAMPGSTDMLLGLTGLNMLTEKIVPWGGRCVLYSGNFCA
ncbi:unnamed protein product, partial [Amoebophrya sp. A25]